MQLQYSNHLSNIYIMQFKMKIEIHPNFKKYAEEIKEIPQEQFTRDYVFCEKRNTVILTEIQGSPMVRVCKINCVTLFFL